MSSLKNLHCCIWEPRTGNKPVTKHPLRLNLVGTSYLFCSAAAEFCFLDI